MIGNCPSVSGPPALMLIVFVPLAENAPLLIGAAVALPASVRFNVAPAAGPRVNVPVVVTAEADVLNARTPSVAPSATVRSPATRFNTEVACTFSVPAATLTGPLNPLFPVSVNVPVVVFVRPAPPLIWATFDRVPAWKLRFVMGALAEPIELPVMFRAPPFRLRVET